MTTEADILLSPAELHAITGKQQPKRQVDEMLERGFWRARLVAGRAIVERAHYVAVCAGARPAQSGQNPRPQVHRRRAA